jgi:TPR repeat protein
MRFVSRSLGLTAALGALLVAWPWPSASAAEEEPAPLGRTISVHPSHDRHQVLFNSGTDEDCAALWALVDVDPYDIGDHTRLQILGEMHDRGVCAPRDPARAFDYFKQAGEATLDDWHLVTAWKLWFGDGVEMDRVESARQFREFAISATWLGPEAADARVNWVLQDRRPLPKPLKEGIDWANTIVADRDGIEDWGRALFRGSATYLDGTPIDADRVQGAAVLMERMDWPIGPYLAGLEWMRIASTVEDYFQAESAFEFAASCGHKPAITALVDLLHEGRKKDFYSRAVDLLKWTIVAEEVVQRSPPFAPDLRASMSEGEIARARSAANDVIGKRYCVR